jgi:L-arabinose isomerase
MDFMNLTKVLTATVNLGIFTSRLRKPRKVVVGYWKDKSTHQKIAGWMRVAAAWADAQDLRIIRFGDNMNNVAVTDGDKVEAEIRLGYHVDNTPIAKLVPYVEAVTEAEIDTLVAEYDAFIFCRRLQKRSEKHRLYVIQRLKKVDYALSSREKANAFTTSFDELEGM